MFPAFQIVHFFNRQTRIGSRMYPVMPRPAVGNSDFWKLLDAALDNVLPIKDDESHEGGLEENYNAGDKTLHFLRNTK